MNKILNYIAKGKGLGLKFVLLFAFIVSIVFAVVIKVEGTKMVPYAQSITNQILPIKVENGVVTEPQDTLKVVNVGVDKDGKPVFSITIDTRVDTLDTAQLNNGIYLTASNIYIVGQNEVRVKKLTGDIELPQGDYTPKFNQMINWSSMAFAIFATAILFVVYYVLILFYAFCAFVIAKINKKKFEFDLRMRLSTLCVITTYVVSIALAFAGINMSRIIFFVAVVALQWLLIKKLDSNKQ